MREIWQIFFLLTAHILFLPALAEVHREENHSAYDKQLLSTINNYRETKVYL